MKIIKIFILAAVLMLLIGAVSAAEDNMTDEFKMDTIADDINVTADNDVLKDSEGEYLDPTEAYECLNEFRTSKGVWYWASDNENVIYFNTNEANQLQPLSIDEGLVEVAKVRAKEIVIHFEHERPDGSSLHDLYYNLSGYDYCSENLAFSYFTGEDATNAWKESFQVFKDQGHRRGMLDPTMNCVGIAGYITADGVPFWVQAFAYNGIPQNHTTKKISRNESKGTFADLAGLISSGISIQLDKDYESFNESAILIDKPITIDGCGHSIDAQGLSRIFNITSSGVRLENIIFKNAYIDYANGGAIHTIADLTLINCSFSDNFAYYGSAIYASGADLNLTGCSFNDNFAVKGSIFLQNGVISIINSTFNNNSAILFGGAVSLSNGDATLKNSIFSDNSAYRRGGAIFIAGTRLSAYNSTFTGNYLNTEGPGYGGAICAEDTNISFECCEFSKNRMDTYTRAAYGGAAYLIECNVSVSNTNFTQNSAMDYGGALCLIDDDAGISGCLFEENSVTKTRYYSNAGALYGEGGNITISESTFSKNTAENGAAIALSTTDVSIESTVFNDNPAAANGAIFANFANLTITDCGFSNNTCRFNGGAVYLRDGKIVAKDSVFKGSLAYYGGALRLENAEIFIENSNFTDNTAKNENYSYGGAVYLNNCQGTVESSSFTNNSVYSDWFATRGGAVLSEGGNVSFASCSFSDNQANYGGALMLDNASSNISDSHFKNNVADYAGGAVYVYIANASISNSIFTNCSSNSGGAVYIYSGNLDVSESVFINNSALWAGAIYSSNADSNVYASNFTQNTATWQGGALYSCNAFDSTFTLNKANVAGAMYGENNNADRCSFIKNVASTENPTYNVTTKDCTFEDNTIIVGATIYAYPKDVCYPGDMLYVQVYNSYNSQYIYNATVTVKIYANGTFVRSSAFSSGDFGWMIDLEKGTYVAVLSIDDGNFEADSVNVTLNVAYRPVANLDATVENSTYGDSTIIHLKSDVDGDVEIRLDGSSIDYYRLNANSSEQLDYVNVPAGNHTFTFILTPSTDKVGGVSVKRDFTVNKRSTSLILEVRNTTDSEELVVYLTPSQNGYAVVKIGNLTRSVYVYANQRGQISFGVLKYGTYDVTAHFSAGENYLDSNASKTFRVSSIITQDKIKIEMQSGESKIITITLPDDAKGNVTLSIAGESHEVSLIKGSAEVTLPDLAGSEYSYAVTYSGDDKYSGFSIQGIVKENSTPTINPDIVIPPLDSDGRILLPSDATGNITLTIAGKDYVFEVINGVAQVILPKLANGDYPYIVTYSSNGKYSPFAQTGILHVDRPIQITAGNAVVKYCDGSYYKITVKNDWGMAESGLKVYVKLNGKAFTVLTTDSDGLCMFKVSQAPGTYKLTITAQSKALTRTLTVKHLLSLKAVTVKKSAKKLVLQASLGKVNGKYLKNKKITFKFNGKTYRAKTNSKGVAKYTVKKSVLKKLKVGKKVTYQATYLKDTVKRTAKVKR